MIYKNFFFFHIPKSGGSSIEKMFLGKHTFLDYTIKMIFKDSKFSKVVVGYLRGRLWRLIVFYLVGLFFYDLNNLWGVKSGKVLHHLTYIELIDMKYITKRNLDNLIKFCIVRNPYDRMISAYHFLGGKLTFENFVKYVEKEIKLFYSKNIDPFVVILPQIEFIIDTNGKIMMNDVLYFENLAEEFENFSIKYNLKLGKLPHINKRTRNKKNIKDYYNQELADIVYNTYRLDFKILGYKKLVFLKTKRKKKLSD